MDYLVKPVLFVLVLFGCLIFNTFLDRLERNKFYKSRPDLKNKQPHILPRKKNG